MEVGHASLQNPSAMSEDASVIQSAPRIRPASTESVETRAIVDPMPNAESRITNRFAHASRDTTEILRLNVPRLGVDPTMSAQANILVLTGNVLRFARKTLALDTPNVTVLIIGPFANVNQVIQGTRRPPAWLSDAEAILTARSTSRASTPTARILAKVVQLVHVARFAMYTTIDPSVHAHLGMSVMSLRVVDEQRRCAKTTVTVQRRLLVSAANASIRAILPSLAVLMPSAGLSTPCHCVQWSVFASRATRATLPCSVTRPNYARSNEDSSETLMASASVPRAPR